MGFCITFGHGCGRYRRVVKSQLEPHWRAPEVDRRQYNLEQIA